MRTDGAAYTAFSHLRRNMLALLGAIVILLFSFSAIFAPILAPERPAKQDYDAILASPGLEHPLGTDRLGRDTLSRLMYGARTSLMVGIMAQLIVLAIGVPMGLISGFASTRLDNLLMRTIDVVYAFPAILLIILLRAVFGGSLYMMVLSIGLASWPTIARLVRAQALSIKEREFVLAATSIGAGARHTILHHLLPNAIGPVIVAITFLIPMAILIRS